MRPKQVSAFHSDYLTAFDAASILDSRIAADAGAISSTYADICTLSIRQIFGAIELTISKNSDKSYNTSDLLLFLKEISSNGNINTVYVRAARSRHTADLTSFAAT
jgi:hypothetical protein